jgi:hypothetical protein
VLVVVIAFGNGVRHISGSCPGAPCDASTLVAPQPVAPADGATWTAPSPVVSWNYAYPACASRLLFRVEVARDESFTDLVVYTDSMPGGWMTFDPAAARLDDCTTYYWHIAATVDGTLGPYSEVWSFRTNFSETCGRSLRGVLNQEAVCRSGPGLDYPVRLYLNNGTEIELTGRNAASTWLVLARPDRNGFCWINARLVNSDDDLALLPVQEAPSPPPAAAQTEETPASGTAPTAQPLACSTYMLQLECEQAGCKWDYTPPHVNGICVNP